MSHPAQSPGHQPPHPAGHAPGQGSALPPPGFIDLTLQGSAMTSSINTPTVTVDGYPVPARYGMNRIPVVPGPHRIYVYGDWMRRYGQAELDVHVQQGQHVPVFYRAPLHQFTTGSIGHVTQSAKGVGFLVGLVVVVLALLALITALAVVT